MDLTASIEPKSDQLDAVDLLTGPRVFTIESVTAGSAEQPVNIKLAEFPRVWRPSKSMRRVLVAAWGKDSKAYIGRRVRLYCDPTIEFGGIAVGGTRISAVSHIDRPLAVSLLVKRGKSNVVTVEPLSENAQAPEQTDPTPEIIAAATDKDTLRDMYRSATPATQELIKARVAELDAAPVEPMESLLDGEQPW